MTLKSSIYALAAILCTMCVSACEKKAEEGCGISGGVTIPNTYLFWIDHDFECGSITVEVKDTYGTTVAPYNGVISYTSPSAPACNNTSYGKYATFDLYKGKTYTYKAICSGRTWAGTINVPCEESQCKSIQLQ